VFVAPFGEELFEEDGAGVKGVLEVEFNESSAQDDPLKSVGTQDALPLEVAQLLLVGPIWKAQSLGGFDEALEDLDAASYLAVVEEEADIGRLIDLVGPIDIGPFGAGQISAGLFQLPSKEETDAKEQDEPDPLYDSSPSTNLRMSSLTLMISLSRYPLEPLK